MILSRRRRARPPNPTKSSSTQPRPFSQVGTVPLFRLHQELPLLWAKDKKVCGLVSRIIKLHLAYSSRVCPVLVGFRAEFGPGGLQLPLMRVAASRLNDNSSLILLCLQSLCWPTQAGGAGSPRTFPPPTQERSPGSARGQGLRLPY